jgi:hypothetical protein
MVAGGLGRFNADRIRDSTDLGPVPEKRVCRWGEVTHTWRSFRNFKSQLYLMSHVLWRSPLRAETDHRSPINYHEKGMIVTLSTTFFLGA